MDAEIGLEIPDDLAGVTMEGELADEKLSGFLISSDLTESAESGKRK